MSEDSFVTHLAAGTTAGVAQLMVGHPFDTIKVKMQASQSNVGALSVLRKTFVSEGVRGIYRGMASPLATVAVINGVLFATRGAVNSVIADPDGKPLTVEQHVFSSSVAGVAAAFLCAPSELFKCRLQHQGTYETAKARHREWVANGRKGLEPTLYRGPIDVLRNIYLHERGIRGLSTGLGATLLREIPGNASMFGVYEGLKIWLARLKGLERPEDLGAGYLMGAGGVAGIFFWLPIYPLDVIKARLQTQRFEAPRYSGVIDCGRQIYAEQGWGGLFKGFGPCMARAFPANAAAFVAYELAMHTFHQFGM